MDPLDFLKVAEKFHKSNEEAYRRSSISRAYYAIFNYVELYLASEDIYIPNDNTVHEKIPRYLRNAGLEKAKEVANKMDELKVERKKADYKMRETFSNSNECVFLILKAKEAVKIFDSCKGNNLIHGIKHHIETVER